MKKVNAKIYIKANPKFYFSKPCDEKPFPEFKSIAVPLKFISYAYICHWTRNEFGEVQYYLPEFINV